MKRTKLKEKMKEHYKCIWKLYILQKPPRIVARCRFVGCKNELLGVEEIEYALNHTVYSNEALKERGCV